MPEHTLDVEHGRHALLMIRLALLGVAEIERGKDQASQKEIEEIRALTTVSVLDSVKLLDLYLTAKIDRRNNDVDGERIVDLVHHSIPWRVRLSNPKGTVIRLTKPSAADVKRGRVCVNLDLDSPIDEDVKSRWKLIDKKARPDSELNSVVKDIVSVAWKSRVLSNTGL